MSDTQCVSLADTVTASRKLLTPFHIFKGQWNGCIGPHKFVTYPAAGKYAYQPKSWMDKALMNEWIEIILMLWKANCDANNPSLQPPIIVLDAYCVHQMGLVVN